MTVQVGIKDSNQPDNGSEKKVTAQVTSDWKTVSIPLSSFTGANLKSVYVLCEFVFPGGPQAQTLRVRNIAYAAGPATTYYFPHLAVGRVANDIHLHQLLAANRILSNHLLRRFGCTSAHPLCGWFCLGQNG